MTTPDQWLYRSDRISAITSITTEALFQFPSLHSELLLLSTYPKIESATPPCPVTGKSGNEFSDTHMWMQGTMQRLAKACIPFDIQ